MSKLLINPSLVHSKEISDICNPLKKLNITYFSHVQINTQQEVSIISNNSEFMEHYYQNEYYNNDIHTAETDFLGRYIIWDNIPRIGKTLQMGEDARNFGIQHTFSIIEKNFHTKNFFHFSTHIENEMMNQSYLANLRLLKLFIMHFRASVNQSKELTAAYEHKIKLDTQNKGYAILKYPQHLLTKNQKSFINLLNPEADPLISKLPNKSLLSKREVEVAQLVAKGASAKEIGEILFISNRTVEHHIDNIRLKLGVNTKAALVKIILENYIC